ncbi:type II toxin-antitoxin system RelB/DinJ family antitoxin [Desulfosarcina sp. OttesenSCG-928-G10]|nr:type II toxin-antitoxin system RelB/DinJ family antitoxin [Desulfosarcina sp. OttesenSCG-928-G10]
MANVQVKIDDHVRDRAQAIAASMGLDLASAVRMFLMQMVRENGIPFKPSGDPFYSPQNMSAIKRSIAQIDAGQTVTKTIEELESMAE